MVSRITDHFIMVNISQSTGYNLSDPFQNIFSYFRNQFKKLKMEAAVCKHFQIGHCRFQDHCRKHHIKELCERENCKSMTCQLRHPKVCKFFSVHNTCKFGEHCAYQHKITLNVKINLLITKISTLENTVNLRQKKNVIL